MGQDKGRLEFENETLLQRALKLLKSCGAERILISGDVEGYDCIPDVVAECGPLGGIYSSLAYIQQEYGLDDSPLLLIPVDMPMLNQEAIQKVLEGGLSAQCCHYEDEVFPCVMKASEPLYSYLVQAFVENTELGGKRSMKGLMRQFKAKKISAKGLRKDVFLNVNRPDDWAMYIAKYADL